MIILESRGFFYNIFCAGGINDDDPWNEKDNRENAVMAFFRDYFAKALNKQYVKIFVLWSFVAYLGVSAWAVSNLEEGLERKRLSRYDSYSVTFYNMEDLYFREYPYRVNVRMNFLLADSVKKSYYILYSLANSIKIFY